MLLTYSMSLDVLTTNVLDRSFSALVSATCTLVLRSFCLNLHGVHCHDNRCPPVSNMTDLAEYPTISCEQL